MKRKYIVHVLIYYYAASLCECRYLAIHGVERLEPLHEQQSESVLRNEKYLCRTADYIFRPVTLQYGSLKADSKSCQLRYSGCGSQDLWFLRHHLYE